MSILIVEFPVHMKAKVPFYVSLQVVNCEYEKMVERE